MEQLGNEALNKIDSEGFDYWLGEYSTEKDLKILKVSPTFKEEYLNVLNNVADQLETYREG